MWHGCDSDRTLFFQKMVRTMERVRCARQLLSSLTQATSRQKMADSSTWKSVQKMMKVSSFFHFQHCFIFTLCLFAVYKEFFALTFSPNFLVTFAFIEVGFKTGLIENSNLLFFNYNSVLRTKIILHTVVLETCTFSDC